MLIIPLDSHINQRHLSFYVLDNKLYKGYIIDHVQQLYDWYEFLICRIHIFPLKEKKIQILKWSARQTRKFCLYDMFTSVESYQYLGINKASIVFHCLNDLIQFPWTKRFWHQKLTESVCSCQVHDSVFRFFDQANRGKFFVVDMISLG